MGGIPTPGAARAVAQAAASHELRAYCERTAERAVAWAHAMNPRIPPWGDMGHRERDGFIRTVLTDIAVAYALTKEPIPKPPGAR